MKRKTKFQYLWIDRLKIPIHWQNDIPHILPTDLDGILSKEQRKQFSEYFGVQTMLYRKDGQSGLYLHDVEAVLVRMFENKLVGTQLYWD